MGHASSDGPAADCRIERSVNSEHSPVADAALRSLCEEVLRVDDAPLVYLHNNGIYLQSEDGPSLPESKDPVVPIESFRDDWGGRRVENLVTRANAAPTLARALLARLDGGGR